MQQFYHYMRQAISVPSFIDFIYANHIVYRRGLDAGEELLNLCKYLLGITAGVTGLNKDTPGVTLEELLWTERMWRSTTVRIFATTAISAY